MLVLGLIRASSLVLVASGRAKSFCAAANALASSVRVRPKFETCAKPCAVQQSLSAAAVAFFSSVGGFANYMSNLDRVHLGFVTVRHYQSSVLSTSGTRHEAEKGDGGWPEPEARSVCHAHTNRQTKQTETYSECSMYGHTGSEQSRKGFREFAKRKHARAPISLDRSSDGTCARVSYRIEAAGSAHGGRSTLRYNALVPKVRAQVDERNAREGAHAALQADDDPRRNRERDRAPPMCGRHPAAECCA